MPATGLSDDQVASELTKMVEFIKKEAEEKAKEIRIKANEEYEIEKAEIVRSEIAAIDKQFDQKYKQAAMSRQILKSTTANKTRLKVLGAKAEVLDSVFEDAEKELQKISKDTKKYEKLLAELILQAIGLMKDEDSLVVTFRESDLDVAKRAVDKAATDAKSDIEIKIDEEKHLRPEGAGGVIASTPNGKIEIDNSLEQRLKLLGNKLQPRIRLDLFGFSKTRRFFD